MSMAGKTHTEETKKLMSEKMTGRKLTEEWKQKISAARKGVPNLKNRGMKRSEEARRLMSEKAKARTDRHAWSDEVKQRMSEGQKAMWAKRKAAVTAES